MVTEEQKLELTVTYLFGARCLQWQHLEDVLDEIDRVMGRNPGVMYPLRETVQRNIAHLIKQGAVQLDRGGIFGRLNLVQRPHRIRLNYRAADYITDEGFQRIREDILQGRYRPQEEMPPT